MTQPIVYARTFHQLSTLIHDDVINWKHFSRNWPFVRGIHRSPVNSLHKGQWRGPLMFSLICVWINDWVNNREAGDLRRYRAHYDVIVMSCIIFVKQGWEFIKVVNTSKPRQNGHHFVDDIFKCIFLNENIWISTNISLKFVPKGQINIGSDNGLVPNRGQAITCTHDI